MGTAWWGNTQALLKLGAGAGNLLQAALPACLSP